MRGIYRDASKVRIYYHALFPKNVSKRYFCMGYKDTEDFFYTLNIVILPHTNLYKAISKVLMYYDNLVISRIITKFSLG